MTPNFITGLFRGLSTAKVRRSALAPFSIACLYITVPCILSLAIIPEKLQFHVFFLAIVPVVLFAAASLFLLFFDRDRLHTEEHLEKKHAMEIVESKSEGLILKATDLVNMVNPEPTLKTIAHDSEEGK